MSATERTWLESFLEGALSRNLCVEPWCTTCGSQEFNRELLDALAAATRQERRRFDDAAASEICQALAALRPSPHETRQIEPAVRLILLRVWDAVPHPVVEDILAGSWARTVLDRMKAHSAAVEAARRARVAYETPEAAAQRRADKARARQEKHRQRLEAKKERDRLWRKRQETP